MKNSPFIKVKIDNISLSNLGFIVFLKKDGDENVLPICIGAMEAHSIAASYNNQKFPRPLSHDLFKNVLSVLNCKVNKIHVTELVDGTFYACIYLGHGKDEIEIDSRPSDAIALALRFGAPIYVHTDVLNSASVNMNQKQDKVDEPPKDPVQRLNDDLKTAVTEERYEDAAKIRDELKLHSDKN